MEVGHAILIMSTRLKAKLAVALHTRLAAPAPPTLTKGIHFHFTLLSVLG